MRASRGRTARAALRVGALLLCVGGCAYFEPDAQSDLGDEPSGFAALLDAVDPFPDPIAYEVVFEGLSDAPNLEQRLAPALQTVARQRLSAPEEIALRRRAAADVAPLERALRAEGYFEGAAAARLETGAALPRVVFTVEPGPRFQIGEHRIRILDRADAPLETARFAAPAGAPAVSADILAAEESAVAALQEAGYAYAALADRDAVADLDARTLDVVSFLRVGPLAEIGSVDVDGADGVESDYIRGFVDDLIGQPAAPARLAERERDLRASGLFRSVRVTLPEEPPTADGPVPVLISVNEAAQRSIGAGLRYDTADGPGGRAFWEHRNLLGRGETLRIELTAAFGEQGLELAFRKPRFLDPQRALLAAIAAESETREAYESVGVSASLGVEERFNENVVGVARILVEISEIDDGGDQEESLLIGLPLELRVDDVDDPLNPTEGYRLRLTTAPYLGQYQDGEIAFLSNEIRVATYYALDAEDRVIAVWRGRVGVIAGSDLDSVPETSRLYAGGGASVRAFAIQRVGPVDADNDPIGGLTAVDAGLELRVRVAEGVSIAPFFDAGFVNTDAFDFDAGDVQAGPGLGVRYASPIGVVRGDVATPIDPREGDEIVQIYISIGQEF